MIDIQETSKCDAYALAHLYDKDSLEYREYFTAFSNFTRLVYVIDHKQKDLFWTMRFQNEICGMFFLRGFDEKYSIPSFGVYVLERFSGLGFARSALNNAIDIVKSMGIRCLMLKVYKENKRAYKLYTDFGFTLHDVCPDTGQDILHLKIQ